MEFQILEHLIAKIDNLDLSRTFDSKTDSDGQFVYRLRDRVGRLGWYNGDGFLHCLESPALVEYDGTLGWFQYGKLHREDGPAIEWADGQKEWYLNGKRHRADGPAVEWNNDKKQWWYDNIRYSLTDYCDRSTASDEQKAQWILQYG